MTFERSWSLLVISLCCCGGLDWIARPERVNSSFELLVVYFSDTRTVDFKFFWDLFKSLTTLISCFNLVSNCRRCVRLMSYICVIPSILSGDKLGGGPDSFLGQNCLPLKITFLRNLLILFSSNSFILLCSPSEEKCPRVCIDRHIVNACDWFILQPLMWVEV